MGFSREHLPHFFLPSAPPRLATPRPLSATSRRHHGPERPQRDPPEAGGTLQHAGDDQLRALAGRMGMTWGFLLGGELPTDRKWVTTLVISMGSVGGKSSTYIWGYKPLTIRGMNHQVGENG